MKLKVTIAVFVVVFLGLFLLHHANGSSSSDNTYLQMASQNATPEESLEIDDVGEIEDVEQIEEPATSDSIFEICKPAPLTNASEIIIKKKAYIVSYNPDTKVPNWVAWHLTDLHTDGPVGRINAFFADYAVPSPRATLEDYRGSGWSRGHMCPAGDNKWSETAMYESFSLVNVCPQNANLNSGLWNSIEMDCRKWAQRYGSVYIVCGPVLYNKEHETIGVNKVVVPEAFFKVILCMQGKPKAIGFIVKNNAGTKKKDQYVNTIDDVERITGYDFFPALPDDIEEEVESHANIDDWR